MAADVPTNDATGFISGRGKPTFPANYDTGTDQGPGVGYGAPLAWGSDLICDPADTDNDCDPKSGWQAGLNVGAQRP